MIRNVFVGFRRENRVKEEEQISATAVNVVLWRMLGNLSFEGRLAFDDGYLCVPCRLLTKVALVVEVNGFLEDDGTDVHALKFGVTICVGPMWDDKHDLHLFFGNFV